MIFTPLPKKHYVEEDLTLIESGLCPKAPILHVKEIDWIINQSFFSSYIILLNSDSGS